MNSPTALETDIATKTLWIPLQAIELPDNARSHSPENLDTLAEDMQVNGQLQEIVVVPVEGTSDPESGPMVTRYQVVAGVGRTLAARKLGWNKLRCFVKDGLNEFGRLHITFSENEEREDANPLYQATLLQKMINSDKDITQEKLAERMGMERSTIAQYLMIAKLSPEVQAGVIRITKLGKGHLLQLCRLTEPKDQLKLAQEAAERDLSVREMKKLIDSKLAPKPVKPMDKPFAALASVTRFPDMTISREGPVIVIQARVSVALGLEAAIARLRQALSPLFPPI